MVGENRRTLSNHSSHQGPHIERNSAISHKGTHRHTLLTDTALEVGELDDIVLQIDCGLVGHAREAAGPAHEDQQIQCRAVLQGLPQLQPMLVERALRYLRPVHFLEEDDWDEEHEEDAEDQPVVLRHCYNVKRTDEK